MNTLSFMTANFAARPLGYRITGGWMQAENTTLAYFRPITSYRERLDRYLGDAARLGFKAVDLWLALLHPGWATPAHLATAQELLTQHQLHVTSLAGTLGNTLAEFEAVCKLAKSLQTSILGGVTPLIQTHPLDLVNLLHVYDLRFSLENEEEQTPQALLTKIGDDPRIGTTVDTGLWAVQGYSASRAIHELRDRLMHIHLKDIRAGESPHTCRYGDGIAQIQACVETLQAVGYTGAITIEHEAEQYDPTDEIRDSLAMLKTWLAS